MTSGDFVIEHPVTRALHKGDDGFSLLELMVVVVILSVLSLMIVPRVIDRPDEARVARAQQDIAVLESALETYRLDNLVYPSTQQGLRALVEAPTDEPKPRNWAESGYIKSLPDDPWGAPYQYLNPGIHGEFDVFSYGPDGRSGGEDDIGNWTDA